MSPEAQRIAIAEACGWTMHPIGLMKKGDAWARTETVYGHSCIPDYLSDLNAMHEAEKVLAGERCIPPKGQFYTYYHTLIDICCAVDVCVPFATAPQRAEAFLRAIGKWEDGK